MTRVETCHEFGKQLVRHVLLVRMAQLYAGINLARAIEAERLSLLAKDEWVKGRAEQQAETQLQGAIAMEGMQLDLSTALQESKRLLALTLASEEVE